MNALKNYFLCNHRISGNSYFSIGVLFLLLFLPIYFYFLTSINPADVQALKDLSGQLSSGKISQAVFDSQSREINARVGAQMAPVAILGFIYGLLLVPAGIMRLKDLNTPWRLLLTIVVVPFLWRWISFPEIVDQIWNILMTILGFVLVFKRGTIGDNQYGPDPLQGVAVRKTRWLMLIGLVVAAIAAIFLYMFISVKM